MLLDTNSLYHKITFDLSSVVKVSCVSPSHLAAEGGKLIIPPLSTAAGEKQLQEATAPSVTGCCVVVVWGLFMLRQTFSKSFTRISPYTSLSTVACSFFWNCSSASADEILPVVMAGVR